MSRRSSCFGAGLMLLALLGAACAAFAQEFSTAHNKIAAFEAEQEEMNRALAAGDVKAAQQHDAMGRRCLREAKDGFEEAGIDTAGDVNVLLAYVAVLEHLGDYDLATETLERVIKRTPPDAALWTRLADNLAQVGPTRRKEAFGAFRNALALDDASPAAAKTWYGLGELYRRESLYDFARECYEKAAGLDPEDILTRIALAALDIRDGKVAEGSKRLDDLGKAAQPYDAETRVLLRQALWDFDAARRWLDDTPENHVAYARVLYRAARWPEAIAAAQRAVRLDPQDYETWNFLAAIQMQLGNLQPAIDAYERSLTAQPEQPDVRQTLGQLKAQRDKVGS